jgi:anti-sigma28 factor (negative regulator of flagellin synthesis)
MNNLYMMATVGGSNGVHGFGRSRRMTFADQIAVDAEMAADDLVAQGAPEVRMDRVLKLKAAIEAGRYFVSSKDVAERIMASMLNDENKKLH